MNILERFESKFIPEPNSGCWLWLGAIDKLSGYGFFSVYKTPFHTKKSHMERAHIASYRIFKGDPGLLNVLHTCDMRWCVNPDHLFLGTHQDNTDDMIRKGRLVKNFGETHPRHTLTAPQVLAIRADDRPTRFIAAQYQINPVTVRKIKRRALWPHI